MSKGPVLVVALAAIVAGPLAGCAGGPKQQSTQEYAKSNLTEARVKTALLEDAITSGNAIKVEVYKGTVQLSGFAKTQEEKAHATDVAKKVEGVEKVVNNIIVRSE